MEFLQACRNAQMFISIEPIFTPTTIPPLLLHIAIITDQFSFLFVPLVSVQHSAGGEVFVPVVFCESRMWIIEMLFNGPDALWMKLFIYIFYMEHHGRCINIKWVSQAPKQRNLYKDEHVLT